MKHFTIAAALLAGTFMSGGAARGDEKAVPVTPAPVKQILEARRFTLRTPFRYQWSKEARAVSSGVLVVLEVDPAYVYPRNSLEPVLYAGEIPVQRLNQGHKSGRVLGLIPGDVDLASTPIWFGTPELPGRVTTDMARAEFSQAQKAGLRNAPRSTLARAAQPVVAFQDLAALLRTLGADLLLEYSPQESKLAEAWRLPVARAPPAKKPD